MTVPSPGSFGGQCPSCRKCFANNSLILQHMNHPRTSCQNWFQYLEAVCLEQSTSASDDNTDYEMANANQEPLGGNLVTTTQCEVVHPNLPMVLGLGPGFMEWFHADPHAEKRSENIYYPFSSKDEWGLTSWLSCSGLSMRATDDLLALPIVCVQICAT